MNQKYNPKGEDIKNNSVVRRKIKREIKQDEQEDYRAELRLAKKLKQNKITKATYEERMKEIEKGLFSDD